MTGARCVPRRGRSRPRPARPIPLLAAPAGGFLGAAVDQLAATERAGGFVQAAVDAYARTGYRPPWLEKSYATQIALPCVSGVNQQRLA